MSISFQQFSVCAALLLLLFAMLGCATEQQQYELACITTYPYPPHTYETPSGRIRIVIYEVYPNPSTLGDTPAVFDWCNVAGAGGEAMEILITKADSNIPVHHPAHWRGRWLQRTLGGQCRVEMPPGLYNVGVCLYITGPGQLFIRNTVDLKPSQVYLVNYALPFLGFRKGTTLIWIGEESSGEVVAGSNESQIQ